MSSERLSVYQMCKITYLHGKGYTPYEISCSSEVDLDEHVVKFELERFNFRPNTNNLGDRYFVVRVKNECRKALENSAEIRLLPPPTLAAQILDLVLRDELVRAVMDDGRP